MRFGESGARTENLEAPLLFPVPCPMHLSYLAVPELYPFMINQ